MNLAKAVAELITSNLKNGDGSPVECVISDSTIGRVAESAACAEKFDTRRRGFYYHSDLLLVLRCRDYGHEFRIIRKLFGDLTVRNVRELYIWQLYWQDHAQKGLPAFGIYGRDVQDLDDIPSLTTLQKNCFVLHVPHRQ